MELHDKGTDRLLTALGVKPGGELFANDRPKTIRELYNQGWNEGERPTLPRVKDEIVHIRNRPRKDCLDFEVYFRTGEPRNVPGSQPVIYV